MFTQTRYAAFCAAVFASFAAHAGTEWPTTPYEGIWSQQYSHGPKNFSVYLEIADANGQLIIDQRDWRDSGIYGRCQYQFAVKQGNVEAIALNEVESSSDNCHKRLPFTLERTDQDILSLKLYPEMAAL